MGEWKEYFMELLGGVKGRVVKGEKGRKKEEENEAEEIREAIKMLKDGKAMETDEIPGKAWRYGRKEVEEYVWRINNDVWKSRGWPERWKEGLVVPIVKKGERETVENNKGVTIMSASYKIYAITLAERLRRDVE